MSASTGRLEGARAQYHLRQSFVLLNLFPINRPEVMLAQADKNIDENGKLTNEETRKLIRQLLEELVKWTEKLRQKTKGRNFDLYVRVETLEQPVHFLEHVVPRHGAIRFAA